MKDLHKIRGFKSCLLVSRIRLIYQIVFYLSIIPVIILMKRNTDARVPDYNWLILIAYCSAYATLIVLRALEHTIVRLFTLEQELSAKGVIDNRLPPNNTGDSNN